MLSIGKFSKLSQVTTKTLRYYDEIGLIKPIHVNEENGYRYYDTKQLETMLLINKLKLYHFSLDEISEVLLNPHDDSYLFSLAKQKRQSIQTQLNQYELILNQLNNDISNLERGIPIMAYLDSIEVKLVETKPQNILFIREIMNMEDTSKYIGKLFERISKDKLTAVGAPMTIFHLDENFNSESCDNELAIPVVEAVSGTRELPGSLCAMATLNGPYSGLPSIYAKLNKWTEAEGYTMNGDVYEVYLTDPFQKAPENFITEVYFPIKK